MTTVRDAKTHAHVSVTQRGLALSLIYPHIKAALVFINAVLFCQE